MKRHIHRRKKNNRKHARSGLRKVAVASKSVKFHHHLAAIATVMMMTAVNATQAFSAPPAAAAMSSSAMSSGGGGGAALVTGTGGGGFGSAQTFKDMSQNVVSASSSFQSLISTVCWLGGSGIGLAAIFKLKQHVDSGGTTPMKDGLVRLGAAGALLAFPFIMNAMQGSISDGSLTKVAAIQLQMDSTTIFH